jgi:hypothetical protein
MRNLKKLKFKNLNLEIDSFLLYNYFIIPESERDLLDYRDIRDVEWLLNPFIWRHYAKKLYNHCV